MQAIADPAAGTQEVQFLALAPDGIQHQAAHRQANLLLLRTRRTGDALNNVCHLMFVLMQEIVVKMPLSLIFCRLLSLLQKIDSRLVEDDSCLTLFAGSHVAS